VKSTRCFSPLLLFTFSALAALAQDSMRLGKQSGNKINEPLSMAYLESRGNKAFDSLLARYHDVKGSGADPIYALSPGTANIVGDPPEESWILRKPTPIKMRLIMG